MEREQKKQELIDEKERIKKEKEDERLKKKKEQEEKKVRKKDYSMPRFWFIILNFIQKLNNAKLRSHNSFVIKPWLRMSLDST